MSRHAPLAGRKAMIPKERKAGGKGGPDERLDVEAAAAAIHSRIQVCGWLMAPADA